MPIPDPTPVIQFAQEFARLSERVTVIELQLRWGLAILGALTIPIYAPIGAAIGRRLVTKPPTENGGENKGR